MVEIILVFALLWVWFGYRRRMNEGSSFWRFLAPSSLPNRLPPPPPSFSREIAESGAGRLTSIAKLSFSIALSSHMLTKMVSKNYESSSGLQQAVIFVHPVPSTLCTQSINARANSVRIAYALSPTRANYLGTPAHLQYYYI